MKHICVDSGFLIGLYDESDDKHKKAIEIFAHYLENITNGLIVPWPSLYEAVSTRMARNRRRLGEFHRDWKNLEIERRLFLLDDLDFRQSAIEDCFSELEKVPQNYRPLSLADTVIRRMLSDAHLKIDVFITFNVGDFQDICKYSRIQIVS